MNRLLYIIFLLPKFLFAQDGIPAAIKLYSGKVLQGTIKQRNRSGVKFFLFQQNKTNEKQVIYPLDAAEVILDENDYFKAAIITKYTNRVDIRDYLNNSFYADVKDISLIEKSIQDTVFLYRLSTGQKISVYKYEDVRINYFIVKEDGTFITLRYAIQIDEKDNVHELAYYKNQLNEFSGNDLMLQKKIATMKWTDHDLIKFADAINRTKTPKKYNKNNGWLIGSGINIMQAGSRHHDTYYPDSLLTRLKYKSSVSPAILFGYQLSKNQESKLLIQLSIGAYLFNTKGTSTWIDPEGKSQTETFPIKGFNTAVSFSPRYIIFSKREQKLSVGVGVNLNYSVFAKTKWTTTQLAGTNPYPRVRPDHLPEQEAWVYGYFTTEFWITKNHALALRAAPSQDFIQSPKTYFYQKNLQVTYIYKMSKGS